MKELYLIPKLVYERVMKSHKDVTDSEISSSNIGGYNKMVELKTILTNKPPPAIVPQFNNNESLKKKNTVTLKTLKKVGEKKNNKNPPLSNLINIIFPNTTRTYALSLLKYFEKSDNMKWDNNGDLFHPLNKYNILEFITNLAQKNKKIDAQYIDDYKYLISDINLPYWLIRNVALKKQLLATYDNKIRKGGMTVYRMKKFKKNSNQQHRGLQSPLQSISTWISY